MTTITAALNGLAATLEAGLPGVGFYRVADGPVPHRSIVLADIQIVTDIDMDGSSEFNVELAVIADARSDNDLSDLFALVEPSAENSIPGVLQNDPTLSGAVADLEVGDISGLREIVVANSHNVGISINVKLYGR